MPFIASSSSERRAPAREASTERWDYADYFGQRHGKGVLRLRVGRHNPGIGISRAEKLVDRSQGDRLRPIRGRGRSGATQPRVRDPSAVDESLAASDCERRFKNGTGAGIKLGQ